MWTLTHVVTLIPTLIVFVLIAFFLRIWLLKLDENKRMIPIHIITVLILVLEIIKQIRSLINGYDLSKLPLYYCSLFLFLYPMSSLCKGKNKYSVRILTMVSGLALFGVTLVMPDVIYSEGAIQNMFADFDDFHTVVFHNLVLLGTLLFLSLELYKISIKRDFVVLIIFYLTYCVIVPPISILSGENFNQFTYNTVGFVENIRLFFINSCGYSFGQSLYVLCALCTTVGFSVLMYSVFLLIDKLLNYIILLKKTRKKMSKA